MDITDLQKAITLDKTAVIYALDATSLVQESLERIDAWPPATKHLGQAMMGAILLQALGDQEIPQSLSLQWKCDGPFGDCYAEARRAGEVRGTIAQPRAPGVADYSVTLGTGFLQIRKGSAPKSMTSIVNATGDVCVDIVEYLQQSEQKNCGLNLSVALDWNEKPDGGNPLKVRHAWGYLIHILPQPNPLRMQQEISRWDEQMKVLGPLSQWALGPKRTTSDILCLLAGESSPQIVMKQRVAFSCHCSAERAERALALLEVQEEKEGDPAPKQPTDIRCEFCGKNYTVQVGATNRFK
jgi:molecular chaperone Hsp33